MFIFEQNSIPLTTCQYIGYTEKKEMEASSMTIGCIILAAGNASRFGSQKLHAQINGTSLIIHTLDIIPKDCPACVVTGDSSIFTLAVERGLKAIMNNRPDDGISRSIRLGLSAMMNFDAICFLVADQPLLSQESIVKMIELWKQNPTNIIRASSGVNPGNPCIFPHHFFSSLLSLTGDHGGSSIIKTNPDLVIYAELPEWELIDCDTPDELSFLSKFSKKGE